uniref:Uncharacterized protein n=1 Tax=Nothobranchius korthausae TaxID=1143690 RepID=A0A1A8H7D4_9TELE
MMMVNTTCIHGNATEACHLPSSPAGLAAELSLLFVLIVITAGVVVFKQRHKIRTLFQRRPTGGQKVCSPPQTEDHQYTREPSEGQTPIYENMTAVVKCSSANQTRSADTPEDDLYLRCDLADEVIYSNDEAFRSTLEEPREDDVYITPDP